MKKFLMAAMLLASSSIASASPLIFATFSHPPGGSINSIKYTNLAGAGNATIEDNGAPTVQFNYTIAGLPGPIAGSQEAVFDLYASATSVLQFMGASFAQSFGSGTLSFTRTTPYQGDTNLLTVEFQNAVLTGRLGSSAGSLEGSTLALDVISMTSDFITFAPGADLDFVIGINTVTPSFAKDLDGDLKSFIAAASANFGSDPLPVPEPNAIVLFGAGLAALGMARRLRRA